jgi:hypothetical protein
VKAKALLAVLGILVLAGSAWACEYTSFMANADCYGWTASGTNTVCGSRDTLAYVVNLKQGGEIIATFSSIFVVWATDPVWSFDVPWGMDLCGDYVAEGHFYYISPDDVTSSHDFSIPFTCDCEEGGCHYTPGYWKNHAEAWPLMELTMGCVTYSQAQLLEILNTPVRGDATIILAYHLIAAKLNVANGADEPADDAIARGDRLLCMYPLFSNPRGPARDEILGVKDELCAFNEYIVPGCGDDNPPTGEMSTDIRLAPAAPAEDASWGAIKNIYR